MGRPLSDRDRDRLVAMAEKDTAKECRRRRIKLFKKDGMSGVEYTAEAQEIFNRAYDYFEGVILEFRRK